MSVHIGEMTSTVEVEPEVGSAPGPEPTSQQETPCPSRAAWELRRRTLVDLARTFAEGYVDEPFFGSSAPVFTVDGEVKGELARDLIYLEVEESTAGLKTLRAHLGNWGPRPGAPEPGFRYFDGAILDFGKHLEVSLGPLSESRIVFQGAVTALEARFQEGHEPQLAVFAEDKLMDLRMTRRFQTYENMTDAQIAQEIAGKHGLQAAAEVDGPTYPCVQQWNQSDLAFLRDRAARVGAEVWIDDDQLSFKVRGSRTGTEVTLVQGSDFISLSVRADLAHQRTKVHVTGYDASQRDAIDEEAGSDALQAEVSGGRSGIDVLQGAFGDRVSYRTRDVALSSGEAAAWAKAELLRRARSFVSVSGVARGQPDLIVGSKLTLQRAGAPFDGGDYYVTRVLHTYDLTTGFRSAFDAERATVNGGGA